MSEKFEKPANDFDKGTLVYATSLMLNCHDKVSDFHKLTKDTLWRLYDNMQDRGNSFANMEDKVRKLERENNELESTKKYLEDKVKLLEKKLRGTPRKNKRHSKTHQ